jgi:hypothetical protein
MKDKDSVRCPWCLKIMTARWYPRHIGRCPKAGAKLGASR